MLLNPSTSTSGGALGAGAIASPALGANVLVLNKFYQAIRVVNVKRAFSLLCRQLAEVVRQRQGFRQVLLETQGAGDRPGDLRDFEAVRQPRPVMIALVVDEDLGLVLKPAERGRMDDAIAVPLERRTHVALRLRMEPAAAVFRMCRVGRARNRPSHVSTCLVCHPGAGRDPLIRSTSS